MIAIITGDIVHSQQVMPNIWMSVLKGELSRHGKSPEGWEIYRGDAFQLRVDAVDALEIAISIKAAIKTIKGLDVRLAIGLGEETYRARRVSESNGTAYVRSGACFDLLKKRRLALKMADVEFDRQWSIHLQLASLIMDEWSTTLAEEVRTALAHPSATQKELAKMINKTPSTVSANLSRAGYHEISDMIVYYQEQITKKSLK